MPLFKWGLRVTDNLAPTFSLSAVDVKIPRHSITLGETSSLSMRRLWVDMNARCAMVCEENKLGQSLSCGLGPALFLQGVERRHSFQGPQRQGAHAKEAPKWYSGEEWQCHFCRGTRPFLVSNRSGWSRSP